MLRGGDSRQVLGKKEGISDADTGLIDGMADGQPSFSDAFYVFLS